MRNLEDENRSLNTILQTFIDDLERVDKKRLKKEEACPICTERFLDGEFDILHGGMIWSGA